MVFLGKTLLNQKFKVIKKTELSETEEVTITAKPSLFLVCVGFFGIILSLFIGFYTFNYNYFTAVNPENILIWIFSLLLVSFALLSLISILKTKKIVLTNTSLIVSTPFMFLERTISFDDVHKVYDQDYEIKRSENFRLKTIYSGKKTIIEFYDNKKLIITSLEVNNYAILSQNLKNITKSYFKIKETLL